MVLCLTKRLEFKNVFSLVVEFRFDEIFDVHLKPNTQIRIYFDTKIVNECCNEVDYLCDIIDNVLIVE